MKINVFKMQILMGERGLTINKLEKVRTTGRCRRLREEMCRLRKLQKQSEKMLITFVSEYSREF